MIRPAGIRSDVRIQIAIAVRAQRLSDEGTSTGICLYQSGREFGSCCKIGVPFLTQLLRNLGNDSLFAQSGVMAPVDARNVPADKAPMVTSRTMVKPLATRTGFSQLH